MQYVHMKILSHYSQCVQGAVLRIVRYMIYSYHTDGLTNISLYISTLFSNLDWQDQSPGAATALSTVGC